MADFRSLEEAAVSGDIDTLYAATQMDPYILEHVDSIPFVDTPLHIATSSLNLKNHPHLHFKYLHFVTEIMRLKPSLALKLNQQGFSPIHLALQNGHTNMVCHFVDINKDLARVRGREGITPLHFVSQTGDSELLAYFLSACPDSVEATTIKGETALHIAVKCKQIDALQVLIGWLIRHVRMDAWTLQRSILNWKDEEGNTILHLSAHSNDIQALDLLAKTEMVNLNAKNSEGLTALDKAGSREIERKLLIAGAKHGSRVKDDGSLAEQRDAYLVVAALIVAAIFQTALSPLVDSIKLQTVNAAAILLTAQMFLFLVPAGRVAVLLCPPIVLFVVSYFYSLLQISPSGGTALQIIAFIIMVLVVNYGLVFLALSFNFTSSNLLLRQIVLGRRFQ
ncbi:hypothetical protein PIB30_016055 [Stylosanthes scabra]|uniref:PGG domain-containing protein n=1 Tax=Stylosanthes scabra TaxID=79078 RepID=A0ABU6Z3T1_9FABA|nr:hypothetical protein [Stylosanthes scabra]